MLVFWVRPWIPFHLRLAMFAVTSPSQSMLYATSLSTITGSQMRGLKRHQPLPLQVPPFQTNTHICTHTHNHTHSQSPPKLHSASANGATSRTTSIVKLACKQINKSADGNSSWPFILILKPKLSSALKSSAQSSATDKRLALRCLSVSFSIRPPPRFSSHLEKTDR